MTTKVEKSVLVNVPVSVAYNQWTQFEDFPHFMSGVKKVTQLTDSRLQWVAEIGGIKRQWEAVILEQIPDQKIAWAATEGATNAGAVTFQDLGGGQTSVQLSLEYEPEGIVETIGDKLNIVEKQAEGDLERFKAFIEDEGYATGAWRGSVNEDLPVGTPGVEDAFLSEGDKGKAGVSAKAVATGVGLTAAAAVAASVLGGKSGSEETTEETPAELPTLATQPVATQPVAEEQQPAATTTDDYYATPIGSNAGDTSESGMVDAPPASLEDLRQAEGENEDYDTSVLTGDDTAATDDTTRTNDGPSRV